jgi:hypothetical protein
MSRLHLILKPFMLRRIKKVLTWYVLCSYSVALLACRRNIQPSLWFTKLISFSFCCSSGYPLSFNGCSLRSSVVCLFWIGLGISDKKIIPRKTELTEQMVISDGIPAVPRNKNSRNSVPNPSAEEKTTRNFVPWNKNRSKLTEFRSEPFSGRENNSEFRSVEQK